MKIVAATIGGLVLIVVIVVGGWQLGWWATQNGQQRSVRINQQGLAAQSADIDQLRNEITTVTSIQVQIADPQTPASELPSLRSQANALTTEACGIADEITPPLPTDEASFAASNC